MLCPSGLLLVAEPQGRDKVRLSTLGTLMCLMPCGTSLVIRYQNCFLEKEKISENCLLKRDLPSKHITWCL